MDWPAAFLRRSGPPGGAGGVSFDRAAEAADELQRVLALLAGPEAAAPRSGAARLDALAVGDRARARAAATCRTWPLHSSSRPGARRQPTRAPRAHLPADASDQAEQRLGHPLQARIDQRRHRTEAPRRGRRVGRVLTSSLAGSAPIVTARACGHGPNGTAWARRSSHRPLSQPPLVPRDLGRPALPGPGSGGDTGVTGALGEG
jgi:hypothetical protein